MKTIAVVKFKNNFGDELIDNLMKCLPIDITVVSIDVKTFNWQSSRTHKASFVVIITDNLDEYVSYSKAFLKIIIFYFYIVQAFCFGYGQSAKIFFGPQFEIFGNDYEKRSKVSQRFKEEL